MISRIVIENFKSLKHIELDCSNLNLFTGKNSMGKSSVLQTMLLLRQSFDKGYLRKNGLNLKGDLVNIGVGRDALFQGASPEVIKFNLSFLESEGTGNYNWSFGYDADSDVLPFDDEKTAQPTGLESVPLFNQRFKYLNADRWVKNQYERSDFHVKNGNLGKHGEYATHYLAEYGSKNGDGFGVEDALLYPGTTVNTLEHQVSAWMNEVSPGTHVNASKISGIDAVKLSYEFSSDSGKTGEISPTNVGFGMTYVLPVIVLLLSAKKGDILVIENPESHLHPKGQSAIGKLIALAAQQGVQIFAESHSDHVVNGICLTVHAGQMKNNLAKIYYFDKLYNEVQSLKYEVTVNADGRLNTSGLSEQGVEGFFDQINKDLETLLFTPSSQQ